WWVVVEWTLCGDVPPSARFEGEGRGVRGSRVPTPSPPTPLPQSGGEGRRETLRARAASATSPRPVLAAPWPGAAGRHCPQGPTHDHQQGSHSSFDAV